MVILLKGFINQLDPPAVAKAMAGAADQVEDDRVAIYIYIDKVHTMLKP